MNERYTKLFVLPERSTRHDLKIPVEVVAGALLKDNQSDTVLAQIKYKNISSKSIKSISVNLSAQDANGVKISGVENYAYETLIATQGDCFGDKTPVIMSDNNTHAFSVDVISVDFSDGTSWNKLGQQAANTAKEVGKQTAKVAKVAFSIPALIVNILFTIVMALAEIYTITDFLSFPSLRLGVAMVLIGLATIISIPGFGRIIFRKKYGLAQRILRWVIIFAILIVDYFITAKLYGLGL